MKKLVLAASLCVAAVLATGCRKTPYVVMPRSISIAVDNSGSAAGQKIMGDNAVALNGLQLYSVRALEVVTRMKKNEQATIYAFAHNPERIGTGDRRKVTRVLQDIKRGLIAPGAASRETKKGREELKYTYVLPTLKQFGRDAIEAQKQGYSWTGVVFTDGDLYDDLDEAQRAASALASLPNVTGIAIGPVLTTGGHTAAVEQMFKQAFTGAGKKCLVWNTIGDTEELRKFLRETRAIVLRDRANPKVFIKPGNQGQVENL